MIKNKVAKAMQSPKRRKRRMLIFDEESKTITVLDKKGEELLIEEASRITIDFEKETVSIRKNNGEIQVFEDLDCKNKQVAYKYSGNAICITE